METILGIDLGTTNSLVALVREGVPIVVPDPETGEKLLPSVVHYPHDGQAPLVGAQAKRLLATDPARTIYSAKRLMGRGHGDAPELRPGLSYPITDDCLLDLGDRTVSAPEVAAQVLGRLKARASEFCGAPIRRAVVTVPAYFNDAQRQATKDAGEIAGLEIVRMVHEPTAAALAYGLQNRQTATIAVYDLGGGTFDISLLRLEEGLFEVLATAGDTHLGGDDFDEALTDWLLELITPLVVAQSPHAPASLPTRAEIRVEAEKAKRALSQNQSVDFMSVTVTRAKFETLIQPEIDRTLAICQQALADADLTIRQIDEVILVGGSTRVPAVRAAVERFFGRTPHTRLDPEEVVALGAAIQAEILAGRRDDLLLLDVTPLSLGIETMGGAVEKLLFRNARIPSSAREEFTTSVDGQTRVLLHVVQGEREMAADNRSLARIELAGIPPLPAGLPKIEVTFLLDANGILQVSAREIRSGARTEVRIKPTYGLSEDDVRQRVRDSFLHSEDDFAARMLADLRTEADAAIRGGEKLLEEYGGTLPEADRASIDAALNALRDARKNEAHAPIREAIEALDQVGRPLAEQAMSSVARALVGGKTLAQAVAAIEERRTEVTSA